MLVRASTWPCSQLLTGSFIWHISHTLVEVLDLTTEISGSLVLVLFFSLGSVFFKYAVHQLFF